MLPVSYRQLNYQFQNIEVENARHWTNKNDILLKEKMVVSL